MPDVTGYIVASDACSGSLTITQLPTNNTVLALGTNQVVLAVSDGNGNTAYSTNTVVVVDTTAPTITMNGTNVLTVECHGSYVDLGATATDNCSGVVDMVTNDPVNPNVPATYYVTYIATDAAGNSATNTRTVNVVDTTPPTITTCVPAQSITNGPGCSVLLPDYRSLLVATDNCSAVLTIVQVPAPATILPVGSQSLTFYVDDGNGNTNSCSTTVTVHDGVVPSIVTQPLSQTNDVGSNVTFTVSATACTTLSYQWYFNTNSALLNQTNASLTVGPLASTNAGVYSVQVSSAGGSTNSQFAILTVAVQGPPVLVSGKLLSDKTFQLTINGPGSESYRVLATTNVALAMSNWVALVTNTFPGVQTNWIDAAATNFSKRIYRLQAPAP
jgi:hypothetical protein